MDLVYRGLPLDEIEDLLPKSAAYRKLKASLTEFGLVEPLVWNATVERPGLETRVAGSLETTVELNCSRCLEPARCSVSKTFDLFFRQRDEFMFDEDDEIELNAGRLPVRVRVENTGDRPIQVGSHTHFFEVNRALRFERDAAYGRRLDIAAGTSLRFEPGEAREVTLIPLAGLRIARGMNGLVDGPLAGR